MGITFLSSVCLSVNSSCLSVNVQVVLIGIKSAKELDILLVSVIILSYMVAMFPIFNMQ